MPPSAKDWSEIAKNVASTVGLVVGGLWVLFQWDTMFPKTRADVQTAAASVRTDVSGVFTVKMGMDDGGDGPKFTAPGSAEEQVGLADYCADNPRAVLLQKTPVFAQLKLKSASAIPVRARVDRVRISTAPISDAAIRPAVSARGAAAAVVATPVAVLDDDRMFFGGMRENRVEKDQEVQVAVMFDAQIPLKCVELQRLALFQVEVALTGVDPSRDRPIGKPVPKIFVTACQLSPYAAPQCNIQDVQAYGQ